MQKMKSCAYCNGNGLLTKEHIWPRSLITKYEGLKTYNPRNNTFYNGEPVIKDVCATCNNVHLSKLDYYLSELYENIFIIFYCLGILYLLSMITICCSGLY